MIENIKDRYYGVEYFGVFQFYDIPVYSNPIVVVPYFTTLIELRTKEGGLKKQWYYTQDIDNPIESINMELTYRGCGILKITFAELLFPIDAEDNVRIRLEGSIIYDGIIDNDVEISNPVLIASPYWKRYSEVLYSGTFTTGTLIITILQAIVEDVDSDTGVVWNADKINLGDTPPTLNATYSAEKVSDIFDRLIEMAGAMYYWGVDTDREFFVTRYDDTVTPAYNFYCKDISDFGDSSFEDDYSKIEYTEAQVWKVDPDDEENTDPQFIGNIGDYGNITYPPIDLYYKLRRKVGKIVAPEYLLEATALSWAYEYLKKNAMKATTVKIKDINIEKIIPRPGDYVMVEGDFDKTTITIIDCEATDNWTNTSLGIAMGKDNEDAIKLFYDGVNDSYYDFSRTMRYYKQRRVGLYLRAPLGTIMEVAFSDSLSPSTTFKFETADDSLLGYYDFEVTTPFQYVIFKYVTGDIYVDNIVVFCETKRQVNTFINKLELKWTYSGIDCDATGGNIENPETALFEKLQRKVKILEMIASI